MSFNHLRATSHHYNPQPVFQSPLSASLNVPRQPITPPQQPVLQQPSYERIYAFICNSSDTPFIYSPNHSLRSSKEIVYAGGLLHIPLSTPFFLSIAPKIPTWL